MAENNNQLLQQFQRWQSDASGEKPDFVEHLKAHSPWIFAHHPQHACFREHVWKINGLYLCKGCVVTAVGFVAGLLLQLTSGWLSMFSEETLALIFVGLLVPTLITGTFELPRPLRHFSRFLLGGLMASALLLLFVTERWDVRIVIIATYFVTQRIFERKRKNRNREILQQCECSQPPGA